MRMYGRSTKEHLEHVEHDGLDVYFLHHSPSLHLFSVLLLPSVRLLGCSLIFLPQLISLVADFQHMPQNNPALAPSISLFMAVCSCSVEMLYRSQRMSNIVCYRFMKARVVCTPECIMVSSLHELL